MSPEAESRLSVIPGNSEESGTSFIRSPERIVMALGDSEEAVVMRASFTIRSVKIVMATGVSGEAVVMRVSFANSRG